MMEEEEDKKKKKKDKRKKKSKDEKEKRSVLPFFGKKSKDKKKKKEKHLRKSKSPKPPDKASKPGTSTSEVRVEPQLPPPPPSSKPQLPLPSPAPTSQPPLQQQQQPKSLSDSKIDEQQQQKSTEKLSKSSEPKPSSDNNNKSAKTAVPGYPKLANHGKTKSPDRKESTPKHQDEKLRRSPDRRIPHEKENSSGFPIFFKKSKDKKKKKKDKRKKKSKDEKEKGSCLPFFGKKSKDKKKKKEKHPRKSKSPKPPSEGAASKPGTPISEVRIEPQSSKPQSPAPTSQPPLQQPRQPKSLSGSKKDEQQQQKSTEKRQKSFEPVNFKFVYHSKYFTQNGSFYAPKRKNTPEKDAKVRKVVEEKMEQFEEMIKKKKYIASGKFGSVSLCEVRGLNRQFVQKTFRKLKDEAETLEAELGVYDKMTSDLFPKLLMAGIGGESRYYHMVIEYFKCGTLFDHREQIQPPDIPFLVFQVATALKQLHDHQLTHGDIKTDNIGIRENGHIVMLDFGCSRFVDEPTNLPITPLCAPEVYEREDAGLPADLYSFGMMILQLYQKEQEPRLKISTGDRLADEFIEELTKEDPAERPLNVFDHQYFLNRNLKPSFFPSELPSNNQQPQQDEEIDKLLYGDIDEIHKKSLIRFPSKKYFFSFK